MLTLYRKFLLMKKILLCGIASAVTLVSTALPPTEPQVAQTSINSVSVNLRTTSPVVLGQLAFNVPEAGKVSVRFDGYCVSDSADLIVLAASDDRNWTPNEGNIGIYAAHNSSAGRSFSHTRVYDVLPGLDTFFAVGQNFVTTNGSGLASVYGQLTVEFFPASSNALLIHNDIYYSGDVRSTQKVLQKVWPVSEPAGMVALHIDGQTWSDAGDRIMVTTYHSPSWMVGSGSVVVMAYNNNQKIGVFSHSGVYNTNSTDTLYAVARNVVDVSGSGSASFYGSLSGEYFPSAGVAQIAYKDVELNDVFIRRAPVSLDSITINAPVAGFALVQWDGYITSQAGDRMVLAVSANRGWASGPGSVQLSMPYMNNKYNLFSHSRLFPVSAGANTFYCVAENWQDTLGDGKLDIASNFIVKYFNSSLTAINDLTQAAAFSMYPNPAGNLLNIQTGQQFGSLPLTIYDLAGRSLLQTEVKGGTLKQLDISGLPSGVLLVKCGQVVKKLVKY